MENHPESIYSVPEVSGRKTVWQFPANNINIISHFVKSTGNTDHSLISHNITSNRNNDFFQ